MSIDIEKLIAKQFMDKIPLWDYKEETYKVLGGGIMIPVPTSLIIREDSENHDKNFRALACNFHVLLFKMRTILHHHKLYHPTISHLNKLFKTTLACTGHLCQKLKEGESVDYSEVADLFIFRICDDGTVIMPNTDTLSEILILSDVYISLFETMTRSISQARISLSDYQTFLTQGHEAIIRKLSLVVKKKEEFDNG